MIDLEDQSIIGYFGVCRQTVCTRSDIRKKFGQRHALGFRRKVFIRRPAAEHLGTGQRNLAAGVADDVFQFIVRIGIFDICLLNFRSVLIEMDRKTSAVSGTDDNINGERTGLEGSVRCVRFADLGEGALLVEVDDVEVFAFEFAVQDNADQNLLLIERLHFVAVLVEEGDVDRRCVGDVIAVHLASEVHGDRRTEVLHAHRGACREDALIRERVHLDTGGRGCGEALRRHVHLVARRDDHRAVHDGFRGDLVAVCIEPAEEGVAVLRRRFRQLADRLTGFDFNGQQSSAVLRCERNGEALRLCRFFCRLFRFFCGFFRLDRLFRFLRLLCRFFRFFRFFRGFFGLGRIRRFFGLFVARYRNHRKDGIDFFPTFERAARVADRRYRAFALRRLDRIDFDTAVIAPVRDEVDNGAVLIRLLNVVRDGRNREQLHDHDDRDKYRPEASSEHSVGQL